MPPTMLTTRKATSLIEALWQIEKPNSHKIAAELAISHAETMKGIAQVPGADALLATLQKKAFFHGAIVVLYRADDVKTGNIVIALLGIIAGSCFGLIIKSLEVLTK